MKAIVYTEYGSPDVLQVKEVDKPIPGDKEVLVKVHAASVNSWDWDLVTGKPYLYRLLFGLFKPKFNIIGSDIAGRVEVVGKEVQSFKVGDEVFGDISGYGFGAFAEYVSVNETVLAIKPAEMTFEEAASIPQAAVLALQGLRQGQVKKGQKILINGAGGGVGTFAVQLAKFWGAEVTAVDHGSKLDLLHRLGADQVVDFKEKNYTSMGQQYDVVLDVVARRFITDYKRALKPEGKLIVVGGAISTIIQTVFYGYWLSFSSKIKIGLLMHKPNKDDLNILKELLKEGKIKPVIDKVFPLAQTAEAIKYLDEGNVKGKVVITI